MRVDKIVLKVLNPRAFLNQFSSSELPFIHSAQLSRQGTDCLTILSNYRE